MVRDNRRYVSMLCLVISVYA